MNKKIRVLFPFVGDTFGGSHISTLSLIDEIRNSDVEPLIGLHQDGDCRSYLDKNNIDWIALPNVSLVKNCGPLKQLSKMLLTGWALRDFIIKHSIDIVHTNDRRMHLSWLPATKLADVKHVWHQRSISGSRRYGYYAKFSDAFITISKYCKNSFPVQLRSLSQVVQDPVSCSTTNDLLVSSRKSIFANSNLQSNAFTVSFVSNWSEQKRPLFFLNMASHLADIMPESVLFPMFGEPREPMASQVNRMVKDLGLTENVLFMGSKSPIEPWIAASDVIAATSVREGLGRTLIEAMQLGVPVVATADGGHLEIIDDRITGRLVDPNSPEEFAQAVSEILTNKSETREMVSRAKTQASEKYSPTTHAKNILAIYDELLN